MILLSIVALLLGVLAYGYAGAQLHSGSREEGGALRSRAWWTGTVLQAVGFLATLLARRSLPLLIVQSTATLGLAVTALLQHLQGVRRLTRADIVALVCLIGGLALLAGATVPGPAAAISTPLMVLMGVLALLATLGLAMRPGRLSAGLLAGMAFSYGAIGARLVIGDEQHPLWIFWQLPWQTWVVGLLTGTGIVLGQVHMTRGLAAHDATAVLGPMYLVETLLPGAVGVWLMGEHPRDGAWGITIVGLALALWAAWRLVRIEVVPPSGDMTADDHPASVVGN